MEWNIYYLQVNVNVNKCISMVYKRPQRKNCFTYEEKKYFKCIQKGKSASFGNEYKGCFIPIYTFDFKKIFNIFPNKTSFTFQLEYI